MQGTLYLKIRSERELQGFPIGVHAQTVLKSEAGFCHVFLEGQPLLTVAENSFTDSPAFYHHGSFL